LKARTAVYNLLRRSLSQRRRTKLKRQLARVRTRLAPLHHAAHGTFDAQELVRELQPQVPEETQILMVHCSFDDLRPAYVGGVSELLDGLLELCGPQRTLAMPAFFFGGPAGDPIAFYRKQPVFDVQAQPSETGLLSEVFRRRRGVLRSLHPTASVIAFGPLAAELVADHRLAPRTFGAGTPYAKMAEHPTAIVGLGVEYFRCLTQVHAAEDLLGERFPVALRQRRLAVTLRDAEGNLHPYELAFDEPPPGRRIDRLERLLAPGELVQWRFHGVPLFVTSAARVTEVLMEAAARGETIYDVMPIRTRSAHRLAARR
jgi:aminoglycoside N3'-acetyltransferase